MAIEDLIRYAIVGNLDQVRKLVDGGTRVNCTNPSGVTALMAACQWNRTDVASFLLDRGADVNARESRAGRNSLMYSCMSGNVAMVRLVLERGPMVDATDAMGQSALIMAASLGNAEVVQLLLQAGAGMHFKDRSGATALQWAREKGHRDVVDVLMRFGRSSGSRRRKPAHKVSTNQLKKEVVRDGA